MFALFFFRLNVLVLIVTALVDPGRIEVPLHGVDPDEMLSAAKKSTYGQCQLCVFFYKPYFEI